MKGLRMNILSLSLGMLSIIVAKVNVTYREAAQEWKRKLS